MRIIKTISLLVILVGGLSFGIFYASKHRTTQTIPPDFRVVYSHVVKRPGEPTKLVATSIRFVRPGDRWKEFTTYYKEDGTTHQDVGLGNAEFAVEGNSGKDQFMSANGYGGILSAEQFESIRSLSGKILCWGTKYL